MIVPLFALGGSEIIRNEVKRPERIFQNTCETVTVQATRLDTLIDSLQLSPEQFAFVWCDVQGSEGAVIRTGLPLWHAAVPLWAKRLSIVATILRCFSNQYKKVFIKINKAVIVAGKF